MTQKTSKASPSQGAGPGTRDWFERLPDLRKDLLCAVAMLLVVYVLFWEVIASNKDLAATGGDYVATANWVKALDGIREREGFDALWMPYLFSGMPVASSLLFPNSDWVNWIEQKVFKGAAIAVFAGSDAHYFLIHIFLGGLFTYMLARSMKLPHLGALLAGFVFLLNPYAVGLGASFHWSKLAVFSYIPLVFLLVRRLVEKRDLLTFGLLSAAIGTMFLNRHPQIAFYGMLLVGCWFLYEFVADIRSAPGRNVVAGLLLVAAVALGLAIYSYEMLPTKEYAEYSVRGGGGEGQAGGASYEWATNWSLHPYEMMTYIVPSWFGFGSSVSLDWKGQEAVLPAYWGWMPATDNPPYIGIVPVVLAVVALARRRNRTTWFLAAFSVLVLFLSFGRYLPVVYDLFYHYFPYFNKFRAPSLVLFLIPLTVGLLAVYGLSWIVEQGRQGRGAGGPGAGKNFLYGALGAAAVFLVALAAKDTIFGMFPPTAFTRDGDPFNPQAMPIVREIRFELLWRDLLRVSAITAILLGLVWAYFRRSIGVTALSAGAVVLLVVDLAVIDRQFIEPRPKTDLEAALRPDASIRYLQRDSTAFRVLALEQNLFRDNTLMHHSIQSVTGYSPAKLKIYQEMYDSTLMRSVDGEFPLNVNVLAMLNTKYVISPSPLQLRNFRQANFDPQKKMFVYLHTRSLNRAWFVDTVVTEPSKTAIYARMNSADWRPNELAMLGEPAPPGVGRQDSSWVKVTKYGAHEITLQAYTSDTALLVLSEIYYPAGWSATIDGAGTKIHRTNAVLRSVAVPPGDHEVRFTFDPESFRLGSTATTAGWIVTLLAIGAGAWRDERVRGWVVGAVRKQW